MFRPEPVISAVRFVLVIAHPPFLFRLEFNAEGLESIASFITITAMVGKLSWENDNQVGRALLARFMDPLSAHDAMGMDFSRTFGAVETAVAGDGAGDPQRNNFTGLEVKQA